MLVRRTGSTTEQGQGGRGVLLPRAVLQRRPVGPVLQRLLATWSQITGAGHLADDHRDAVRQALELLKSSVRDVGFPPEAYGLLAEASVRRSFPAEVAAIERDVADSLAAEPDGQFGEGDRDAQNAQLERLRQQPLLTRPLDPSGEGTSGLRDFVGVFCPAAADRPNTLAGIRQQLLDTLAVPHQREG